MSAPSDAAQARAVAADPHSPQSRLRELAASRDPGVVAAVASNPNAPLDLLLRLLPSCPDAVLQNPSLELLEIEAPGSLTSLPAETLGRLLGRAAMPAWLARQLLGSIQLSHDQRLCLACSPTTLPAVLLALAAADSYTVRYEVARNAGLPAEGAARLAADPQPGVRAALACSTSDAAILAALAADPHPSPRLFARSRLEPPPAIPPARTDLDAGSRTSIGQRQHNEDDAFFGPVSGACLALVTDGMGGSTSGELAAQITARELPAVVERLLPFAAEDEEPSCLGAAVAAAHEGICRLQQNRLYKGIGATVVAALFCEDRVHVAHVGDSRMYRLRQGVLEAITRDHSLINEYLTAYPDLSPEKIDELPRNVIMRALGIRDDAMVADHKTLSLAAGDVYLLCTDGLHDAIPHEQMTALLLAHASDAAAAARALIDAADNARGQDNATAVVIGTRSPPGHPYR